MTRARSIRLAYLSSSLAAACSDARAAVTTRTVESNNCTSQCLKKLFWMTSSPPSPFFEFLTFFLLPPKAPKADWTSWTVHVCRENEMGRQIPVNRAKGTHFIFIFSLLSPPDGRLCLPSTTHSVVRALCLRASILWRRQRTGARNRRSFHPDVKNLHANTVHTLYPPTGVQRTGNKDKKR